jgi:putative Mn2+ efflux pump MntP
MDWISILIIAVGLGMDAFAVSIVAGSRRNSLGFRPLFRLSFHFGLFQFLMPLIGWFLGTSVSQYIMDFDHWIAFALLSFIGIKMLRESFSKKQDDKPICDPTRGGTLIMLSVATSIDALAVGLSLAFLGIEIWVPAIVIGLVALAMTAIGMIFGKSLGTRFGKFMELIGGFVLIGIGIRILIEHIYFM